MICIINADRLLITSADELEKINEKIVPYDSQMHGRNLQEAERMFGVKIKEAPRYIAVIKTPLAGNNLPILLQIDVGFGGDSAISVQMVTRDQAHGYEFTSKYEPALEELERIIRFVKKPDYIRKVNLWMPDYDATPELISIN